MGVLRELVASLRTITELQNPAITERHWLELMQETQVSFLTEVMFIFKIFLCFPFSKSATIYENRYDVASYTLHYYSIEYWK